MYFRFWVSDIHALNVVTFERPFNACAILSRRNALVPLFGYPKSVVQWRCGPSSQRCARCLLCYRSQSVLSNVPRNQSRPPAGIQHGQRYQNSGSLQRLCVLHFLLCGDPDQDILPFFLSMFFVSCRRIISGCLWTLGIRPSAIALRIAFAIFLWLTRRRPVELECRIRPISVMYSDMTAKFLSRVNIATRDRKRQSLPCKDPKDSKKERQRRRSSGYTVSSISELRLRSSHEGHRHRPISIHAESSSPFLWLHQI